MSNEELALKGINDADAMGQLYQNNLKAIHKICNRFKNEYTDIDDLIQEAYFALIVAVQAYNKNTEYKFITYLVKALEWHFIRYSKRNNHKRELLTLDAPISNDGESETTKADMLPDETAAEEFEQLIDNVALNEVFEETKIILDKYTKNHDIKTPLYDYIADYYINNMTYNEMADKYNVSRSSIEQGLRKAYSALQNTKYNKKLKSIFCDVIGQSICRSGFSFFQTSGMSSVEWAIIEIERQTNELKP